MELARSAGVLLHPSSLPGPYGIGDLGPPSYCFVDFLADCGFQLWQVLPLSPTGYGNSPYQALSAFAGNPLLISLEKLVEEQLLSSTEVETAENRPSDRVDYDAVTSAKSPLLRKAWKAFRETKGTQGWEAFDNFCREEAGWLDDFALFSALKERHHLVAWTKWDTSISQRDPEAINSFRQSLDDPVQMRKFWQFLFRKQWVELKNYCRERSIKIMGDIPIFVAHDSAEVWAKPELFDLDDEGEPRRVAGVPPDYFSETGQLWGNPLYRWDRMGQDGYSWWVERFRSALDLYDLIRLDHFRGFEAYWSVPADEKTAVNGEWIQGPGSKFFRRIEETFGKLPIVAENLGWITPEVEALRKEFGYPGMAILQFAFGTDPQLSEFIPHNVTRNTVYYTGTHDNDTVAGWWQSLGTDDSTRTSEQAFRERELARRYLATNGSQIHWDFIRAVFSSTAKLAVVPLQDLLGLGSDARMNLPGTTSGNWLWRFSAERLNEQIRHRVKDQLFLYGRLNRQIDPQVTDP